MWLCVRRFLVLAKEVEAQQQVVVDFILPLEEWSLSPGCR